MRLEEKVALVTGAGRGIGRVIAIALAAEGAEVIVNYHGSQPAARMTADEIVKAGGKAQILGCDVSDEAASRQMMEEIIGRYGRLDILVNNAGITRDNLVMKMSEEEFDAVMDTNLKGAFHCIRHASRQMLRQRAGRIINISSVAGVLGNAGQANYSASKSGLIGLSKAVARELAGRGITVNVVAPGFIRTQMTDALPEAVRTAAVGQIPMKRFGEPEEIARAVLFLASEDAGYITGQVICVDGGMAM